MLTIVAHRRGLEAFTPITAPSWDLEIPADRQNAHEYILEVCRACAAALTLERDSAHQPVQPDADKGAAALTLVEEVVHFQRIRGRAAAVKKLKTDLLWTVSAQVTP